MCSDLLKNSSRPGISSQPHANKKAPASSKEKRISPSRALIEEAKRARVEFEKEQSRQQLKDFTSWGLLFAAVSIIIFGIKIGFFDPVINILFAPAQGVYADCSLYQNRHSRYCAPSKTSADKQWDSIAGSGGKAMPYNLNDAKR